MAKGIDISVSQSTLIIIMTWKCLPIYDTQPASVLHNWYWYNTKLLPLSKFFGHSSNNKDMTRLWWTYQTAHKFLEHDGLWFGRQHFELVGGFRCLARETCLVNEWSWTTKPKKFFYVCVASFFDQTTYISPLFDIQFKWQCKRTWDLSSLMDLARAK